MQITIIDEDKAEKVALQKAIDQAMRWQNAAGNTATITVNKRAGKGKSVPEGWLEYLIQINDALGLRIILIGMIQRTPESEFEFHS